MENKSQHHLIRQLAHLKVVSRLLGHELHSQGSAKTITLSREQIQEIQTTVDLFIEEVSRSTGGSASSATIPAANIQTAGDVHLVPTRN